MIVKLILFVVLWSYWVYWTVADSHRLSHALAHPLEDKFGIIGYLWLAAMAIDLSLMMKA